MFFKVSLVSFLGKRRGRGTEPLIMDVTNGTGRNGFLICCYRLRSPALPPPMKSFAGLNIVTWRA